VGHSLGGLLVQLVAARTHHAGMVAACPSSVGPSGLNPTTMGLSIKHALQPRPWAKPVYPPSWERFRRGVAQAQTEQVAREMFADFVCESGRALFFELAVPWLDRARAAAVDFAAVTTPVLVIAGEYDRILPPRTVRQTAAGYKTATYIEIPRSDHLVFCGKALPVTMGHIDDWTAENHVFRTT
jgi:pimeloyl-ACP methyl ester carboxylesterase